MFKITTTGTAATVRFPDLGGLSFTHPTTNFDLETKCTPSEIAASQDVQAALLAGTITAQDENNSPITDVEDAGPMTPAEVQVVLNAAIAAHNAAMDTHSPFRVYRVGTTASGVDSTDFVAQLAAIVLDPQNPNDHAVIRIMPGVYNLNNSAGPIVCKPSVDIVSDSPLINSVIFRATDPTQDLFQSPGSVLFFGVRFENVGWTRNMLTGVLTDNGAVAVRVDGPVTGVTAFFQCAMHNVATGVLADDGNSIVVVQCGLSIAAPNQQIGTLYKLRGGSVALGTEHFITCPAAILPYYQAYAPWIPQAYAPGSKVTAGMNGPYYVEWIAIAPAIAGDIPGAAPAVWQILNVVPTDTAPTINPIQTVWDVDEGSIMFVSAANYEVAYNVNTTVIVRARDGAVVTGIAWRAKACGTVIDLPANSGGYAGAPTNVTLESAKLINNFRNVQFSELTAQVVFASVAVDVLGINPTTGVNFSGTVSFVSTGRTALIGGVDYQYATGESVDVGKFLHQISATGVVGHTDTLYTYVTAGAGLNATIAAGQAWLKLHGVADSMQIKAWGAGSVLLDDNATNYIYVDATGVVDSTASPNISDKALLAKVVTSGGLIQYIHNLAMPVTEVGRLMWEYFKVIHNIVHESGFAVTASGGSPTDQINISAGVYWVSTRRIAYAGANDVEFRYFRINTEITGRADLKKFDLVNYAPGGVSTAMTAAYYRADTVYVTSDGQVTVVMGDTEFATQGAAEDAGVMPAPNVAIDTAISCRNVIIQKTTGIVSFVNVLPRITSAAPVVVNTATDHSDLTGLGDDDHAQYILVSGARAMGGNFNMGNNNITNLNLINGISVTAHASRHNPGGADALATAAAVSIGTANTEGNAASFARSNHGHDHAAQTDPTHHAVATQGANGFMSSADKTILDRLVGNYAFYYKTSAAAVAVVTPNVFQNITFDVRPLGVGITGAAPTADITLPTAGIYEVTYSVTLQRTANPSANGEARLTLDNVELAGSALFYSLPSTNEPKRTSRTILVSVTANQVLRVQFTGGTVNVQMPQLTGTAAGVQPQASVSINRVA